MAGGQDNVEKLMAPWLLVAGGLTVGALLVLLGAGLDGGIKALEEVAFGGHHLRGSEPGGTPAQWAAAVNICKTVHFDSADPKLIALCKVLALSGANVTQAANSTVANLVEEKEHIDILLASAAALIGIILFGSITRSMLRDRTPGSDSLLG
eukprot:gnl/TRDRNA2_/TRDRNA2_147787_c0_seq1.p2 gnl/TRDRNA2_/TRDRNA2_147787_c0~~gnl/TRDRNA2_/TRDRNA2_147787_c0_seq1.p2  ORF type:complete len:152 (-),score=33.38 gnl/TRDRNA2_/TRDRNA2_147787_c0_seq1:732-1187(-)